jgi:hypothetical protein
MKDDLQSVRVSKPGLGDAMGFGRLVRVSRRCGDPSAVVYVVAIAEAAKAVEFIRQKLGQHGDEIEDLGHVSDALMQSLSLAPGAFMRADDLPKR